MFQPVDYLSNLDPNYDYYLYTPRTRIPSQQGADMKMMHLRAQIEETNRLLRNMSSSSGSNTPLGSTGTPASGSERRPAGFANRAHHPGNENGGQGQMIKVPRIPVQELTSQEIMNSILSGRVTSEPFIMNTQREMLRKYNDLEEKYRQLEDKVLSQKQKIKSMKFEKDQSNEAKEKQRQLESIEKQLFKLKNDMKLRERSLSVKPESYAPLPALGPGYYPGGLISRYYPTVDPGYAYQMQKDMLINTEVGLLKDELSALNAMKAQLK